MSYKTKGLKNLHFNTVSDVLLFKLKKPKHLSVSVI